MDYMQQALSLAKQALGNASPNPAVGAVVVKDGTVVGEGCTQPPGSAHAEVVALRQAGDRAHGAAMWVTLEPCCHFGRTSPCTHAVIASSISEVHMAMLDPNPLVSGKGKAELERVGIKTYVGEEEQAARELNEAYVKHITTGLPFVSAKFAMSLDGKIATRCGYSQWISGKESRRYVHDLRSKVDAIMVGVNTVLTDDPQLTARYGEIKISRQPLRVIVDSQGRTPLTAHVLRHPNKTLIAVASIPERKARQLTRVGTEVLPLPGKDSLIDLERLLRALGEREITNVLVEGGETLLGSLFDLGLVDKVIAIITPVIIGGKSAKTAVGGIGIRKIGEALHLGQVNVDRLGQDMLISGYIDKEVKISAEAECSAASLMK
ncbi:bifunctional diaminohydroxyphosphoribosylaminopyrimidine deaminase/5-amino-6-(5-phosphoribosylamino)uracil reductase RibD [Chloroflexota bacterium]